MALVKLSGFSQQVYFNMGLRRGYRRFFACSVNLRTRRDDEAKLDASQIRRVHQTHRFKDVATTQHIGIVEQPATDAPSGWKGKILVSGASAVIALLGFGWYFTQNQTGAQCQVAIDSHSIPTGDQPETELETALPGRISPELPFFRRTEIKKHNNVENGLWVTFDDGVYDITEFVQSHPGGEKIMLAAGGPLEPFWNMYQVHRNQAIYGLLEEMRIGNVHPDDKKNMNTKDLKDPYGNDPERHPAMHINSLKPYDAETPPELLTHDFITPNALFYVRNHLPVPHIDVKDYRLQVDIEGDSGKSIKISMNDLKTKFKLHTETITIQCAGNRRNHMHAVRALRLKGTSGMTAISNAEWTGVKLVDVLQYCGVREEDYQHVHFVGLDKDISGTAYEASIPIETAMDPRKDVLLAFQMNGEDLPLDHGYPLRLVVPGTVGARQVKWLGKITLSKDENQGHWQQKDYKTFHPSIDWATADFTDSPALQDYPLQSAICEPKEGAHLTDNEELTVKGYAWSGGGRGIIRVEVSADGGKTWHQATLRGIQQKLHRQWAWKLFEATIPLPKDSSQIQLVCKAVDSSHNQQPDSGEGIWNMMGLVHNAWHRITVNVPLSEMD